MNIAQKRLERRATRLIAANDMRKDRIRYRGTRPAWNWLARQDKCAAAGLWLLGNRMLPQAANDNNEPGLTDLDRRRMGRAVGRQFQFSILRSIWPPRGLALASATLRPRSRNCAACILTDTR